MSGWTYVLRVRAADVGDVSSDDSSLRDWEDWVGHAHGGEDRDGGCEDGEDMHGDS